MKKCESFIACPDDDDVVKMFCAYCRKTLVNAKTDFYREQARYAKHEQLFSEMSVTDFDRLCIPYRPDMDETVVLAGGREFCVCDIEIADALNQLTTTMKTIILLYYFAGWSDQAIAREMQRPRSTIQYQRHHALTLLRSILEQGGGER